MGCLTTRALKICKVRATKRAHGYGVSVADDDPFRIQESIEIRARLFDLLAYVDNLFRQDFPNVSDAFVLFSKFDVCPDTLDEQEWWGQTGEGRGARERVRGARRRVATPLLPKLFE